jgi:hypothetical protein
MGELACKLHGSAPAARACRHVIAGIACGVHVPPGGGERADAWCDRCDELAERELQLACIRCYDAAVARNRDVPPHARGARATLTVEEHRALFDHATGRLAAIQEAARARWQFDTYERWDFDPDTQTLAFSAPDRPTIVAGVRLVGTFKGAFRWAWVDHDESDLLAAGSTSVRAFGEVRGIAAMTARDWPCRLRDAWELSSVAGYLLGCDGIYRAQFDDRFWFLLLAGWRHARRGSTESGFGPD